jgi:hypothetical protein
VKGYAVDFGAAVRNNDVDYLKSPDKLKLASLISFPSEVEAERRYYQLTSGEFYDLAVAYYRLRYVINQVRALGDTTDVEAVKKQYTELTESLKTAIYFINKAFEDNACILTKIGRGTLFAKWRELMRDYPSYLQDYQLQSEKLKVGEQLRKRAQSPKKVVKDFEEAHSVNEEIGKLVTDAEQKEAEAEKKELAQASYRSR